MRNKKIFILTISAFAIALNIVLGTITSKLNITFLFLDTIGTILIAALYGPWYGAAVGALSNILSPILSGNPKNIPFFLVNMAVGIIVGYIAKKYGFKLKTAIVTGLILAVVAPLIGSPIGVILYGGVVGSGQDILVTFMRNTGMKLFQAFFTTRLLENFIDKVVSCLLVAMIIPAIPNEYKILKSK